MDWSYWMCSITCLMVQVYISLHATAATQCNQNLTAVVDKQLLTSPGYPIKYDKSLTCWWRLSSSNSTQNVILETVDLMIQPSSGCVDDSLIIYDGDSNSANKLHTLCGDSRVFVTSSGRNMYLEFRSNSILETRGFQFRYYHGDKASPCTFTYTATRDKQVFNTPGYPDSYFNALSCEYSIQAWDANHRLQVDFTDTDIQSSQTCGYDKVTVADIASGGAVQTLSTICGRRTSSYQSGGSSMKITFTSDASKVNKGFSAQYKSVPREDCLLSLLATDMDSYILSPGYPTQYYRNLNCRWNIFAADNDAVIELVTMTSNISDTSPSCSGDRVSVTNSNKTELGTFCGTNTPRFESTGPNMTVVFTTDGTNEAQGFLLKYKQKSGSIPTTCGGSLTAIGKNKYLGSPGYPKENLGASSCSWTITADNEAFVQINLLDLDVEFGGDNLPDTLKIYNGASTASPLLATWRGQMNGYCLQSSGNVMHIVYRTDDSNNGRGFNISYRQPSDVNDGDCLSYDLDAASTYSYITSPRNPLSYPGNSDRPTYHLSTNHPYRIKLEVLVSDLPEAVNGECTRDYVTVYDGFQATSMPLKSINTQKSQFCGKDVPTFVSTSYVMLVVFHTAATPTNTGFQMRYKKGHFTDEYVPPCGGSLTATDAAKNVTSPNYPNSYDGEIRCPWTITASDSTKNVRLTGTDFQLHATLDVQCQYQPSNLRISDGTTDESPSAWECGNQTLIQRQSTRHVMTLLLRADSTSRFRGFNLQYFQTREPLPCDFTIGITDITRSGKIVFPGNVEGSTQSRSCSWLLRRENVTKVLDIRVRKADIIASSSCTDDQIMVYDGNSRSSPLIWRFCGIGLPSFRMSGRDVLITFVATSQPVTRTFELSYREDDLSFWTRKTAYAVRKESTLTSPNYPLNYQRKAEYSWDLYTVDTGKNIVIKVVTSDIEMSEGCVNDRVQVHDGASKNAKLLGKWCGTDTPTYRSSRQHIGIYLISNDNEIAGKGFEIQYFTHEKEDDSNVGAIVGGVIGALLAVCLIGAIAFIIIKKPFSRGVRRNPKASYGVK
ncbi:cubilin-like [Haliotis rufescens]|uniref:cubilin-like n=1 Tax=Haliotis rufescens TaxID=6454 RepID=UPI00201E924C|nr:cubilin-like [Haliotis rufescens]